MRAVDDVVLAMLGDLPFTTHDSLVVVDKETNVVTLDLPYAVYASSVGDDDNPRLTGRKKRRSVFFTLMYVGEDRNQAKAAGEAIREVLQGKRLVIPDYPKTWLCQLEASQRVRRDDDAIRPDGSPLFYGMDEYAVSVMLATPAA